MTFSLTNPLTVDNLIALLQVIITGLIRLSIPIAVILIIWAGVLYMTATGKPEQLKTATRALIWVILGFGILLIASGIVSIIQDFLGVTPPDPGVDTMGPSTLEELLKVLTDISGWLFTFAIIAGVAIIITAGLVYIFSGGNTERAGRALRILLYAIIGVAIAALAWAIINIISNFLTGNPIFATLISEANANSDPLGADRPTNAPTGGPTSITEFFQLLENAVEWLFIFTVIAAVAVILAAGLMYILAGGDQDKTKRATRMFVYAIIGLIVALLVFGIVNTIGGFLAGEDLVGGGGSQPSCQPGQTLCFDDGNCHATPQDCDASGCTNCIPII